jgi:hypothetical protein
MWTYWTHVGNEVILDSTVKPSFQIQHRLKPVEYGL